MLQVRGPMMVAHNWQPATMKVGIWKKDMTIIQSVLQSLDVPAPLFQASLPIYAAAMSLGMQADDTAAVYEVLERLTGKDLKKAGSRQARSARPPAAQRKAPR